MRNRIKALKALFKEDVDGYIITNQINMLYFSDFFGAAVILVPSEDEGILYVHSVNFEAAKAQAKNCRVELVKRGEDPLKRVAEQVRSLRLEKLGFDTMSVQTHQKLNETLKNNANLEAKSEYAWNLRSVKDNNELKRMRKAAELTIEGIQTACEIIKPGIREYQVAAEMEYTMRTQGSYGVAFDTIVASGAHSAYPHGGCGDVKLKDGDLVVVDVGAVYKNYRSDMTRTFVVGKPSAKQERIYAVVKTAQEKAFQKMQDGVKAAESDAASRTTIEKAGYGKYFVHGLGHGVGLEVHEQPVLNPTSKDVLKAGNVVTDEPGVYIVGYGGFRIEDTVLVRKGHAERLTKGRYALGS